MQVTHPAQMVLTGVPGLSKLDRVCVELLELLQVVEVIGRHKAEQSPELLEVVLQQAGS